MIAAGMRIEIPLKTFPGRVALRVRPGGVIGTPYRLGGLDEGEPEMDFADETPVGIAFHVPAELEPVCTGGVPVAPLRARVQRGFRSRDHGHVRGRPLGVTAVG